MKDIINRNNYNAGKAKKMTIWRLLSVLSVSIININDINGS